MGVVPACALVIPITSLHKGTFASWRDRGINLVRRSSTHRARKSGSYRGSAIANSRRRCSGDRRAPGRLQQQLGTGHPATMRCAWIAAEPRAGCIYVDRSCVRLRLRNVRCQRIDHRLRRVSRGTTIGQWQRRSLGSLRAEIGDTPHGDGDATGRAPERRHAPLQRARVRPLPAGNGPDTQLPARRYCSSGKRPNRVCRRWSAHRRKSPQLQSVLELHVLGLHHGECQSAIGRPTHRDLCGHPGPVARLEHERS